MFFVWIFNTNRTFTVRGVGLLNLAWGDLAQTRLLLNVNSPKTLFCMKLPAVFEFAREESNFGLFKAYFMARFLVWFVWKQDFTIGFCIKSSFVSFKTSNKLTLALFKVISCRKGFWASWRLIVDEFAPNRLKQDVIFNNPTPLTVKVRLVLKIHTKNIKNLLILYPSLKFCTVLFWIALR